MSNTAIIVIIAIFAVANLAALFFILMRMGIIGRGGAGGIGGGLSAAESEAVRAAQAEAEALRIEHERAQTQLIMQQLNDLNRSLSEHSRVIDSKLGESSDKLRREMRETATEQHRTIERQTSESIKAIHDVTDKLARLDETQKQVQNFTSQLQDLQDILKNPKKRGILGEYYLETLLKNVLTPGGYAMQYKFPDGTIVDAVVFVRDKIIPIDSKFSLENYNRLVDEKDPLERERLEKLFKSDLKNRIDETAKYVQPSQGTMDFAFMFIPHEAIYYDLLVAEVGGIKIQTRDLIEYAFKEKHVLIVSPTSFLAFLQTVLQGLKALQIEESAKEIRRNVENLEKHLRTYEEYHRKLGTTLGTAVNHYNSADKQFRMIDKDVARITGGESTYELLSVDKPPVEGE